MNESTIVKKPTMSELQLQLIMILPGQRERQDALKEFLDLWDIKTLKMK